MRPPNLPITSRVLCYVGRFPIVITSGIPLPGRSGADHPRMSPLWLAFRETAEHRWRLQRSRQRNESQAATAITTVEHIAGLDVPLEGITPAHLKAAVKVWQAGGTRAATILLRLNCLSAMGVNVRGCRPRLPRNLKWWLSREAEDQWVAALQNTSKPNLLILASYIRWTTRVGLRVEESLALRRHNFHRVEKGEDSYTIATIPGTKTYDAQATLRLSSEAAEIAWSLLEDGRDVLFEATYKQLLLAFNEAKRMMGVTDRLATLKALRRSAARDLHARKGMPIDLLRQYMRHQNVSTTMGYLRLTGGYGEEEYGKWL